jgi:uncharacterized protein YcfJ
MTKIIKTTMAAVVTTGLILGSAMAPTMASARPYTKTEACQVTKQDAKNKGAIIGAIAGGLLGTQISKNEKGLGAVAGAGVGYVLGSKIGKDQGKSTCKKIQSHQEEARHERRGYKQYRDYGYNDRQDRYDDRRW